MQSDINILKSSLCIEMYNFSVSEFFQVYTINIFLIQQNNLNRFRLNYNYNVMFDTLII